MPENNAPLPPPAPKPKWPWDWTGQQREYYESLPFMKRPPTFFGMWSPAIPSSFYKPTQMSWYAQNVLGGAPQGATVAPQTPAEKVQASITAKREAEGALGGIGQTEQIPPPNGIQQYYDANGNLMVWNGIDSYVQAGFDPTKIYQPETQITPYQQAQIGLAQQEQTQAQQQAQRQYELQQQQFQWSQQQARAEQEEQERQYRAQLMANPMSWLEYSSYTGQAPRVQPWMLPLMSQQYGLKAGQRISGWTGQSATKMPQLLNPSMQYWNRMSPTMQQQYMGYEKARTGQSPEDIQWRMQSMAPPSGYRGLRWSR